MHVVLSFRIRTLFLWSVKIIERRSGNTICNFPENYTACGGNIGLKVRRQMQEISRAIVSAAVRKPLVVIISICAITRFRLADLPTDVKLINQPRSRFRYSCAPPDRLPYRGGAKNTHVRCTRYIKHPWFSERINLYTYSYNGVCLCLREKHSDDRGSVHIKIHRCVPKVFIRFQNFMFILKTKIL